MGRTAGAGLPSPVAHAAFDSDDVYAENPEWERQHRAFHRALLAGCGPALLLGFCEQLYDPACRLQQLAARVAHKRRNQQDELEQARALLAEHYRRTASIFEHERGGAGSAGDEG